MKDSNFNVLLTRTEFEHQNLSLKYPNINWIDFPLIRFEYQKISSSDIEYIKKQSNYLVFTSQNAVKSFFQQVDDIGGNKIICVGPKTARIVESFGRNVSFIPSKYTSFDLAKELTISNSSSLTYIGGNLSSSKTIQTLSEKSGKFTQIESYKTVSHQHKRNEWLKILDSKIDVISFCSPSAVSSFMEQISKHELKPVDSWRFAAIGQTTKAAILQQIDQDAICPKHHTFEEMIKSIVNAL